MNANEISKLLVALEKELHNHGEKNWIRGITAARETSQSGDVNQARSIYASMNQGINSFADYSVWHEDFATRLEANTAIDKLRMQLWSAFEL